VARYRLEVGPVPLHHQVYVDLKSSLDSGEYAVDERLPPERELARLYGCSLITIRRALDELSREGRLQRHQGRGTFVLPPRLDRDIGDALSFTDEMQRRGLDPETRLIAARRGSGPRCGSAALLARCPRAQRPVHFGSRFSKNAFTPSWMSSVVNAIESWERR